METTIQIRRDADGSTENLSVDITRTNSTLNIHLNRALALEEGDIIMLPLEVVSGPEESEAS